MEELIKGINDFWESVTVVKCRKYIGHLQKVLPEIIIVKGDATGY